MTPRELLETIARMPISPAARRNLLRAARAGGRMALFIVRAHRWRQAQPDRPGTRWIDRLWRQIWHR